MATHRSSTRQTATAIYQLKVTLKGSKPPIWRRIQTRGDITLAHLHYVIQDAMGWENDHLHQFEVGGVAYAEHSPDFPELSFATKDEWRTRLSRVAPAVGRKFTYEYDFGDGWDHSILVEKILEPEPGVHYPRCLVGRRACPPEDCGGIWGYYQMLETLGNPEAQDYEVVREWMAPNFDPDAFSVDAVNARLKRMG